VSIEVTNCNDAAIFLKYKCAKGEYEFIYTRATQKMSRCLCSHGSHWRGNSSQLCLHARAALQFLTNDCNLKVTP